MNEVEEMQRIMVSSAEFAQKIAFFLFPSFSLCPLPSVSMMNLETTSYFLELVIRNK